MSQGGRPDQHTCCAIGSLVPIDPSWQAIVDENYIQLFVRSAQDHLTLLEIISNVVGYEIDAVETPRDGAISVATIFDHDSPRGFAQRVALSFPLSEPMPVTAADVAAAVAKRLSLETMFEVEEEQWVLVASDGSCSPVEVEDIEDTIEAVRTRHVH